MNKEMQKALEADGEKLQALTGEDHGPVFIGLDLASGPDTTLFPISASIRKHLCQERRRYCRDYCGWHSQEHPAHAPIPRRGLSTYRRHRPSLEATAREVRAADAFSDLVSRVSSPFLNASVLTHRTQGAYTIVNEVHAARSCRSARNYSDPAQVQIASG